MRGQVKKRASKVEPVTLVAYLVTYYSKGDEDAFFRWLKRIRCVTNFRGVCRELLIEVAPDQVDYKALREFIGLFRRYGVDMRQLAVFETTENAEWFRDKQKFWYEPVFGKTKIKRRQPGAGRAR